MSATIQVKFGTLSLDATNNITVSPPKEKSSKAVQTTAIPMMDGAIAETAKLGPKTITIEGDIAGSSYDDLRTNLDALHAGLLGQGLAKLTKDNERYIYCQLKDFSFAYSHMTRHATWSAQFIAHDPFWYSESLTTDTRAPTSGTPYTLTNSGNAPSRLKVEVTADGYIADAFQLANTTLGTKFQYRGTIAAAKTLNIDNRVDTDDFKVLNDSVSDHVNFEGDFLTLGPGTNIIDPIFTASGALAPTVQISYRKCWY